MSKLNQIFTKEELIGKTISSIVEDPNGWDDFYMSFTDGSFAVLVIEDISEGFQQHKEVIRIDAFEAKMTDENLVTLGIITAQECEEAQAEEERRSNETYEKQLEEFHKSRYESDIQLLKELQAKYGTNPE